MAGISLDALRNLSPEFQQAYQSALKGEQKVLQRSVDKKSNVDKRLGLLGDAITKVDGVRKQLPELGSPQLLREVSIHSGDERVVIGKAENGKPALGTYPIEVLKLATPSTAMSNAFSDKDETRIGTGYFAVTLANGQRKEVFIDDDNATLEGVANTINASRLGIRASILQDDSDEDEAFRLVITSEGVGTDADVEFPEFYFVDGEEDFSLEEFKGSSNALIRYQGLDIESPTNTVKGVIPGVTLSLRGLSERAIPITVEQDTPKTTGKIKNLVEGLNQFLSFVQEQNKLAGDSQTQKTLGGDYGIRLAEQRLRSLLQSSRDGDGLRALRELGVQFNKSGTLTFDEKKMEGHIQERFDEVARLLAGDESTAGFVPELAKVLDDIAGKPSSLLSRQKKEFAERSLDALGEVKSREKALQKKADGLKTKLGKAQIAVTTIQQQSDRMLKLAGNNF